MQAPPLGFDWGSWYGIVFAVAVGITTIGSAAYLIVRATKSGRRWLRPPEPLVAFGHPHEDSFPFVWFIGPDTSDDEVERQQRAHEENRLSSLSLSYLIENKDSARAMRELSTGIRAPDGGEYTFDSCFVQILAPGQTVDVPIVTIPSELCEGMAETNRAENFLYWARFRDADGHRWEATYEPRSRAMNYRLLSR
jgi:hypothetical protein